MHFHPYYNPYFLPYFPPQWNYESTQLTAYNTMNLPVRTFFENEVDRVNFREETSLKMESFQQQYQQPLYPASPPDKPVKIQEKHDAKTTSSQHRCQYSHSLNQHGNVIATRKYHPQKKYNINTKIKINSFSNILRLFLRRISSKSLQLKNLVSKIIRKLKLEIQLNFFMEWLDQQHINHRIYLTPQTVRRYFEGPEPYSCCNKIMRILFENFIKSQGVICYLTSKKTKKESLFNNLSSLRQILKELFN